MHVVTIGENQIGQESYREENHCQEDGTRKISPPRYQALDERRRAQSQGAFQSPHAGREDLEGTEAHGWRAASPGRYPWDWLGPVPLTGITRAFKKPPLGGFFSFGPKRDAFLLDHDTGGIQPDKLDLIVAGANDGLAARTQTNSAQMDEWDAAVRPILLEISPVCDVAQHKRRNSHLVGGLVIPATKIGQMKKGGDAWSILPPSEKTTLALRWPLAGFSGGEVKLVFHQSQSHVECGCRRAMVFNLV